MHQQPLKVVLLLVATLTLGACSTAPIQRGEEPIEPVFPADRILHEDIETVEDVMGVSDPWQGFNRTMYRFNYHVDRFVLLPAVAAYETVLPDFARQGVNNFLENLRDITTLINSALQLSGTKSFQTAGRMFVNTTIGLLGVFDVASVVEIPKHDEDFGQTLGYWGAGTGPFLVLPVFGPSNVRDGTGLVVDTLTFNAIDPLNNEGKPQRTAAFTVVNAVDQRANIGFRYFRTGSPFEYEWVRRLYTTKRRMDIAR
jgi:phospholipid-binding lipoprotein MlaA